jgi:hypothetical protein
LRCGREPDASPANLLLVLNEVFSGLAAAGTIATAAAVWVGIRQVKAAEHEIEETKKQALTSFEDDLTCEYRSIVGELPAEAFYIDGELELNEAKRRAFYRYFDLSNEQLFLARLGRVSQATCEQWRDGIVGNLRLPAFRAAWHDVEPHIPKDFFEDLRGLIAEAAGGARCLREGGRSPAKTES